MNEGTVFEDISANHRGKLHYLSEQGRLKIPFILKRKTKPQSGGKRPHEADLCDFNVVLRRRLTQSCQVWVLRPAVGK